MSAANAVVAAVQATPVFLDRDATVDRACELTATAAAAGASLVVFPEAFVPGYPDWVWRTPAWSDGKLTGGCWPTRSRCRHLSVDRLGAAAAEAGVYLAIGVNEADGGTLYNTLLYFAPDGTLAGRHRKLMPTGGERTIWGAGDGSGPGRGPHPVRHGQRPDLLGELHAAGPGRGLRPGHGVYLAPTWDNSDTWVATLQHIAKEGRVYVVGVAPLLHGGHVPADLRGDLYQDDGDWMSRGHTTIVGPTGKLLAGPLLERADILYATIDVEAARLARRMLDPIGHYARPDIFTLTVNTNPQQAVRFIARHPDADLREP